MSTSSAPGRRSGHLPLYVHSTVRDYPFEPLEFILFARIVGYAGWNGGFSRESPADMHRQLEPAGAPSKRMIEYALKFLVEAKVVEQVLNSAATRRLGWKPLEPETWVSATELPSIRNKIYTNRKESLPSGQETSQPSNVVPLIGKSQVIEVPHPTLFKITPEMTAYIETEYPYVVNVGAELQKFYAYYKKPKVGQFSGEVEVQKQTMGQWQDKFVTVWLLNANAKLQQQMGATKHGTTVSADRAASARGFAKQRR